MGRSTSKGFIIGTVVGTLLGVAGGMLFAPKKGTEIRKDVTKTLKDYQGKVGELAKDLTEKGKELTSAPESVSELSKRIVVAVSNKLGGNDIAQTSETQDKPRASAHKYFKGTK